MASTFDSNIVDKYIDELRADDRHRYLSWDNCFNAFASNIPNETKVLHLAFYLASWGMYRGSSGLLQKNHTIHNQTVEILTSAKYSTLQCHQGNEVNSSSIPLILDLKKELADHYGKLTFKRGENTATINATDTLTSKIILGTLGCVPAYDRYFLLGIKEKQLQNRYFDKASLTELFNYIGENGKEILQAQAEIKQATQKHYPVMKILDMHFWQIGYNKDMASKPKKP